MNFLEEKFKFQESVLQIDFFYPFSFCLLILFCCIECRLKGNGKIISFPKHEF